MLIKLITILISHTANCRLYFSYAILCHASQNSVSAKMSHPVSLSVFVLAVIVRALTERVRNAPPWSCHRQGGREEGRSIDSE